MAGSLFCGVLFCLSDPGREGRDWSAGVFYLTILGLCLSKDECPRLDKSIGVFVECMKPVLFFRGSLCGGFRYLSLCGELEVPCFSFKHVIGVVLALLWESLFNFSGIIAGVCFRVI